MKLKRRVSILLVTSLMILGSLLIMPGSGEEEQTGWGQERFLSYYEGGMCFTPKVKFDDFGNAFAFWASGGSAWASVWTCRYDKDLGWGDPEIIWTRNEGTMHNPDLDFDSSGNAIMVWLQKNGSKELDIWASRWTSDYGWDVPQLIDVDVSDCFDPQIEVDPSGSAVVVWIQRTGYLDLWSTTFDLQSGWSIPELIETENEGNVTIQNTEMDQQGNVMVVWQQFNETRVNVWANRYVPGIGWSTPTLLQDNHTKTAAFPDVKFYENGNAISVWHEYDGTWFKIWSSRYTFNIGWSEPHLLESSVGRAVWFPGIAVTPNGMATVVWQDRSVSALDSVWAKRYEPDTGWGPNFPLEDFQEDDERADDIEVVMDQEGNTLVVWEQVFATVNHIMSRRYIAGEGWEEPEFFEKTNNGYSRDAWLGVGPNGDIIAVWVGTRVMEATISTTEVKTKYFTNPDKTPPILNINGPDQDETTEVPVISVSGTTEPGADLIINGLLIKTDPEGSFKCNISLQSGSNVIQITAEDRAGNSATIKRTVHYIDPIQEIRNDIIELFSNISSIYSTIDDLENELEGIKTELDLADKNISSLKENITDIRSMIKNAETAIISLQGFIAALSSDIEVNQDNISSLTRALDSIEDNLSDFDDQIDTLESDLDTVEMDTSNESEDIRNDVNSVSNINIALMVILVLFLALVIVIFLFLRRKTPGEDEE